MPNFVRDQVFISYSHHDKDWLEKLQTALAPLIRQRKISVWDDTQIAPGSKWRKEIEHNIARSKVAVLLVTQQFLASDFIAENELPPLLQAAEKDGLTILWIAAEASMYEVTEINNYQAVNDPARPLESLSQPALNEELVKICKVIKSKAQMPATDAAHGKATGDSSNEHMMTKPSYANGTGRSLSPRMWSGVAVVLALILASGGGFYWWRQAPKDTPPDVPPQRIDESTPNLIGKIERVVINEGADPKGAQVLVDLSIRNTGTPTSVDKYSLKIKSNNIAYSHQPTDIPKGCPVGGNTRDKLNPDDSVDRKTLRPLMTHYTQRGWLRFIVPGSDMKSEALQKPGVKYVLTFADVNGKSYSAEYVMN